MAITVAVAKAQSLHERTLALTDSQIQSLLDRTSRVLYGLGVDETATDFTAVFDNAHMMLFDWYVANPHFLKSFVQGAQSEVYSTAVPQEVLTALRSVRKGGFGEFVREGGY